MAFLDCSRLNRLSVVLSKKSVTAKPYGQPIYFSIYLGMDFLQLRPSYPQITEKEGFSPPKFQRWYIIFFAGVVTLTELTGSAAATYELAGKRYIFPQNKSTILFPC